MQSPTPPADRDRSLSRSSPFVLQCAGSIPKGVHPSVQFAKPEEVQQKVGETAQAIQLRQSGEQSIMGGLAASVCDSLTQVLRWAFWWNSFEELPENVTAENVLVELNTDLGTSGLLAADLVAVGHAWQCGAMSQDSMLDLFRKSEVLPEGGSNAEEAALFAAKPPLVPVAPKAGPGIAGGQESLPVGPARGGADRGGLQN